MTGPLLVKAYLGSPLAGDPPHLDALMEWCLSPFQEDFRRQQDQGEPHYRVDRSRSAPPLAAINIPLLRINVGGWPVACCSSPILQVVAETVEHVNKRIGVEAASLLAPEHRRVIATTNSWTKSYRLPLRVRVVPCVAWFARGNRREVQKVLRDAKSIGKKVADGYGRVREWIVEDIGDDWSWFSKSDAGMVLMRPLPQSAKLPSDLIGSRRDFGACCPPYWHSGRNTDIMVPC